MHHDYATIARNFVEKIRKVASKVPFAVEAAAMYYAMLDPKTPLRIKATAAGALIYFIAPLDAIVDFHRSPLHRRRRGAVRGVHRRPGARHRRTHGRRPAPAARRGVAASSDQLGLGCPDRVDFQLETAAKSVGSATR